MTATSSPAPSGQQAAGAGRHTLRLGSMCSGYEGLGMAVASVLDVDLTWVADPDPGAAAILAHHYPDVPNLGDITAVDWTTVPPIDVLAAGFPCQDISYAGRGAGIKKGTRSGLWHTIAEAVRVLRPGLVVLENVRAIVSRRPGLDVVLADLARLGFDAEWACVRASAVGAPHKRERWFLVAQPADLGHERGRRPGPADGRVAVADAEGDGRDEGRPEPARLVRRPDAALGRDAAADPTGLGRPDEPGHDHPAVVLAKPGTGRGDLPGRDAQGAERDHGPTGRVAWGPYAAAVHRWERVLGRPAPHPTEPGRDAKPRLSPRFVEWLMGLPAGHVTDPAIWTALAETRGKRRARFTPTTARNAQLKALGNGVVWQQGAAALSLLLDRMEAA